MEDYVLQMNHITKLFPGVKALDDVTFDVRRGEVHALVGENGAGKSTLMKVLSGEYTDYSGELILNGEKVSFKGIKESEAAGIAIIHQELGLIQTLTVCENIFWEMRSARAVSSTGITNMTGQRNCSTS
ncbi:ATP-binding cassette domain-containing protein [Anaerotruncus sp. DFI.9.16]|uniref:ATP-binding cassette domain-containing protein n=1 Tax=Anaerotruncus sp. DFI.9.16 TaxID=2965275 RepID=UPI00352222C5